MAAETITFRAGASLVIDRLQPGEDGAIIEATRILVTFLDAWFAADDREPPRLEVTVSPDIEFKEDSMAGTHRVRDGLHIVKVLRETPDMTMQSMAHEFVHLGLSAALGPDQEVPSDDAVVIHEMVATRWERWMQEMTWMRLDWHEPYSRVERRATARNQLVTAMRRACREDLADGDLFVVIADPAYAILNASARDAGLAMADGKDPFGSALEGLIGEERDIVRTILTPIAGALAALPAGPALSDLATLRGLLNQPVALWLGVWVIRLVLAILDNHGAAQTENELATRARLAAIVKIDLPFPGVGIASP